MPKKNETSSIKKLLFRVNYETEQGHDVTLAVIATDHVSAISAVVPEAKGTITYIMARVDNDYEGALVA